MSTLLLASCSTKNDVAMNEHYQRAVIERERARLNAIAEIASQGETGAVAAAMMMQNTNQANHSAPNTGSGTALQWAGVLVPSITQGLSVAVNGAVSVLQSEDSKEISMNSSNNNKDVAISTNSTMNSIAEATIVTNTSTSSSNTLVCVTDENYSCD